MGQLVPRSVVLSIVGSVGQSVGRSVSQSVSQSVVKYGCLVLFSKVEEKFLNFLYLTQASLFKSACFNS